uniref:Methyltransferase-like protein 21D n=2 Tax=Clastoptera arizonana TaxID=38151 RepID=A0A1B6C5F0_9HEMI
MNCDIYKRDINIDSLNKTLTIYQKEIGEVSCVVWDAALVLSKYLEIISLKKGNNWMKNIKVLELGSGLGCVGLTASCFGADVLMTDLPEALEGLQYNIDTNQVVWSSSGGKAHARPLKWGEQIDLDTIPDIVLFADCIYYEESIKPLMNTLIWITNSETQIILSQEERDTDRQKSLWKNFLDEFVKYFEYKIVPLEEQHPLFNSADICLLQAKKKQS